MKVVVQRVLRAKVSGYYDEPRLSHQSIGFNFSTKFDILCLILNNVWNTRTNSHAIEMDSLIVDGHEINSISKGLCLLVGLQKTDEKTDIDAMVQKILKLRLFDHGEKKWHCNVTEMNYEILSISQFTLCYKLKGNKLDFHMAMPGNLALESYQYFLDTLRKHYNINQIKDGAFGKKMEVEIVNDGPVTVQLEFPNPEKNVLEKSNKADGVD